MAISYRAQDAGPPSPALTNPDMILPYTPNKLREYSSSPSRTAIPRSIGPDMAIASQTSTWTPPLSGKSSRPSMPGAWQTEEDLSSTLHSNTNGKIPSRLGMGHNALKSPSSRFLNTLDPKLRAGLGVEVPEYSPSVYSPTDSEMAQRSPDQDDTPETPVDEQIDEPEDPEHEARFRAFLEEDDDDPNGDTSLSLRAEGILANAKKRLMEMENNLNRARSLSVGRSASATPSAAEVNTMGKDWTISAAKLRGSKSFTAGNTSHSRVFSDTSVPNPKPTLGGFGLTNGDSVRSASAMGSTMAGSGFGASDTPFSRNHKQLEPLQEDELLQSPIDSDSSGYMGNKSRPTSKPQLSDLQLQMQDLKGKIDSLKQRAREDSVRRRSTQVLKASSPFTNAELTSNSSSYIDHSRKQSKGSRDHSPDRSDEFLGENHAKAIADFDKEDELRQRSPNQLVKIGTNENHEDTATVDTYFDTQSNDEAARIEPGKDRSTEAVNPSKTGDQFSPHSERVVFGNVGDGSSQPSPASPVYETDFLSPDLPPPSLPTPHEERPDAFDYETYVLNSTMGSFSRQGHHSRSSSISSSRTASTTKPTGQEMYAITQPSIQGPNGALTTSPNQSPTDDPSAIRPNHGRQDSTSSTSTTATFATAVSGLSGARVHRMRSDRDLRSPNGSATTPDGFLSPSLPTSSPTPTTFPQQPAYTSLNKPSPLQNQLSHPPAQLQSQQQPQGLQPLLPPDLLPPKRNSFNPSPLPSPTPSNLSAVSAASTSTTTLPKPTSSSSNLTTNTGLPMLTVGSLSPDQAKAHILSALLAGSTGPLSGGTRQPSPHLFWAPEDEMLVGRVVDGVLKVCGGMIRGDDKGLGRGKLEGLLGVLSEGAGNTTGAAATPGDVQTKPMPREEINGNGNGMGGWL